MRPEFRYFYSDIGDHENRSIRMELHVRQHLLKKDKRKIQIVCASPIASKWRLLMEPLTVQVLTVEQLKAMNRVAGVFVIDAMPARDLEIVKSVSYRFDAHVEEINLRTAQEVVVISRGG